LTHRSRAPTLCLVFIPVSLWFPAFVLTVAVEAPIVWFLARGVEPNSARLLVLVVFANLVTHPAVWFIFTQLLVAGTAAFTIAAETWAIGVEAIFYAVVFRGLGVQRALGTSLVANATSYGAGLLTTALLPGRIA
jgi:hypothetical protein